jgi:NitT/TauT family transport system substrate-binding protein
MVAILLAACRPSINYLGSAAPGQFAGAAASASAEPAAKLQPDQQVGVQVHLFRGLNAADAPLQYAQALDIFRPVNLEVNLAPPIPGYDPFAVEPAPASIDLWVGTVADVAPAVAEGLSLEAVGEVTGKDPTVLVTKGSTATASAPPDLSSLAGKSVLADTTGAAASLRAALVAAGMAPATVKIVLPDDPSAPFDPTQMLDGSVAAAAVSAYDGWARIQEAAFAAGVDPAAFHAQPLREAGQDILGELVWVQTKDLADPQLKAAVAAFLATLGTAQVDCRNALQDCAGTAAAQSDRSQQGIAWSIDQLDRLLFPSQDGILHIDEAAWSRTIAAMQAADVTGTASLTMSDALVDEVLAAVKSSIDVYGTNWTPPTNLSLLGSPAP